MSSNPLVTPIPVVPIRGPFVDSNGMITRTAMLFLEELLGQNATGPIIGWNVDAGTIADPAALIAAAVRSGTFDQMTVVVTASDPSTDLVFQVTQNGTTILGPPGTYTVAAGAAVGAIFQFLEFTTSPLPVAQNDLFELSISGGTSRWQVFIALNRQNS